MINYFSDNIYFNNNIVRIMKYSKSLKFTHKSRLHKKNFLYH